MLPTCVVITRPYRHVTLAAREKRAGEDEGAAVGIRLEVALVRRHRHEEAVHAQDVTKKHRGKTRTHMLWFSLCSTSP